MKMILVTSLILLTGCNSSFFKVKDQPELKLAIGKNFDAEKTGWITPTGDAIKFTIDKNIIQVNKGSRYECRAGLKSLISAQQFSDCSSGSFQPAPTDGISNYFKNSNGTYLFEVNALNAKNVKIDSTTQEFYVHDSLDNVPICDHTITDQQYFEAASQYLSMTEPFGAATSTKAPHYVLEFKRLDPGYTDKPMHEIRTLPSLRKSLKINADKTLAIIKRTHNKWASASIMVIHNNAFVARDDLVVRNPSNEHNNYQISDSKCSLHVQSALQVRYRNVAVPISDGMGGYNTTDFNWQDMHSNGFGTFFTSAAWTYQYALTDFTSANIDGRYARPYPLYTKYESLFAKEIVDGTRTTQPTRTHNDLICDTLVVNARGKAVCFMNNSLIDPVQMRSVAYLFNYEEQLTLNHKLARIKIQDNATWANIMNLYTPQQISDDFGARLYLNP